ncbi:PhzF family phenazine biosynthesis protein [Streptomyces noursei]|uniref:PhzF family phenazine biosynthesis protein n=1 Tax=Streptomyces noursei TaxID=1971 RepID=UPI0035D849D3
MIAFETLRVFCGADGRHGNALAVVRDGAAIPEEGDRLAAARRLGFSEAVFVDDAVRGVIDIYTPTARMPFAGHPCVGAAWLLGPAQLSTPAGTVRVRRDGEFTWITAFAVRRLDRVGPPNRPAAGGRSVAGGRRDGGIGGGADRRAGPGTGGPPPTAGRRRPVRPRRPRRPRCVRCVRRAGWPGAPARRP